MKTLTLEIKDETIADKIVWMLQHFKNDGLVIRESEATDNLKASIKQSVDELNMVKSGKLRAKPVEELLNAI
ncbi:MAG: hypothetical protein AABY36_05135 [Campylobacterota bacterium]